MRRTATRHILTLLLTLPLMWPLALQAGAPEAEMSGSAEAAAEQAPAAAPVALNSDLERIKKDLLKYCGHDTLAMVRIREALLKLF